MNALTRDLIKLTDIAETQGAEKEEKLLFREHFHLQTGRVRSDH